MYGVGLGKKNLFCIFGPAYCKCFMLLFLQYILEFETRITKDTAAENLKSSCHIVKYIDRLLIWGCKFFFYGQIP